MQGQGDTKRRRKMNRIVTLESLVRRIEFDNKMLEQHPENADMIRNHIERQKQYILDCVLKNSDNPALKNIVL